MQEIIQNKEYKKRKFPKHGGIYLCLCGLFFLFEPQIIVLDIFPDFIGYFLILLGIYCVSDINSHMQSAFICFRKLIVVNFCQYFFLIILVKLTSSDEQATGYLLCAFVFLFLKVFYCFPAWNHFFEGVLYLGVRHECNAILRKCKLCNKKQNRIVALQWLTYCFIVIQNVVPVFSEWSVLSVIDYKDGNISINLYDYVDLFRVIGIFFALLIGIIWLISMVSCLKEILKDWNFLKALEKIYDTDVASNDGIFVQRRIKFGFIFLGLSVLLSGTFYVDNINVIPEFLFPIVLSMSLILFYPFIKRKMAIFTWILALGTCILGCGVRYFNFLYFNKFLYLSTIYEDADALHLYHILSISTYAHQVFCLVSIIMVNIALCNLINNHTGFMSPGVDEKHNHLFELHREERRRLFLTIFPAVLSTVCNITYRKLLPTGSMGFLWIISLLTSLFLFGLYVNALTSMFEQVQNKYQLSQLEKHKSKQ